MATDFRNPVELLRSAVFAVFVVLIPGDEFAERCEERVFAIGGEVDAVSVAVLPDESEFEQRAQFAVDDRGAEPRFARESTQIDRGIFRREEPFQDFGAAFLNDEFVEQGKLSLSGCEIVCRRWISAASSASVPFRSFAASPSGI